MYVETLLGVQKTRLFQLVKEYRQDPEGFSIAYKRTNANNRINPTIHSHILDELRKEHRMIENPAIPLKTYNYSYLQSLITEISGLKVSLSTIITIAKRNGFCLPKRQRRIHDREVSTHYIGELLQHDASFHLFAPDAEEKWYLITTIDDYSRLILYARLVKKETSWTHILALQDVMLTWGIPLQYYVDSHSIFRFVQGRDSVWRKHYLHTDDVDTQWKQVLNDLKVKVAYALSPQAKGKIERPYRWFQDRVVRTCAREGVTRMQDAQEVIEHEQKRYNYHQLHSTTGEIPIIRFERAQKENQSLFRPLRIPSPFQAIKDIFCLRVKRTVDAYHHISINNLKLRVHTAPLREEIELRIIPSETTDSAEVRIWYKDKLTNVYQIKNSDLGGVHF